MQAQTSNVVDFTIQKAIIEINQLDADIRAGLRNALTNAIRIGELLTNVKASLNHGEFMPWVEKNCPFKRTQANAYMTCFSKLPGAGNLPPEITTIEGLLKYKPPGPAGTVGWREAVEKLSPGPLPPGFRPGNAGASKSQRQAVEAAYGAPIPERVFLASDEAVRLAKAVRSVIDAMPSVAPDALAALQAKYDAVVAELKASKEAYTKLYFYVEDSKILRERWAIRETEFKAELTKALEKKERELTGDGFSVPKKWTRDQRFRQLLQLTHPDKHGGSQTAQEVTSWLNVMRKAK